MQSKKNLGHEKSRDREEVTLDVVVDDEDEASPQGTFYVLGDDEDEETPVDQIPSEFSTKSSSSSSWELPELTPQVDHSFVETPPRSMEAQESLEMALRRQSQRHYQGQSQTNNFRVSSNSNSNSKTSPSRTTYLENQNQNQNPNQNRQNLMNKIAKGNPQTLGHQNRNQNQNEQNIQHQNVQFTANTEERENSGKKFGYVLDGNDVRKYRVEERTSDGYIVGEYGVLNNNNGFLRGVRYTADGTINPRLIHEALMKFLSL